MWESVSTTCQLTYSLKNPNVNINTAEKLDILVNYNRPVRKFVYLQTLKIQLPIGTAAMDLTNDINSTIITLTPSAQWQGSIDKSLGTVSITPKSGTPLLITTQALEIELTGIQVNQEVGACTLAIAEIAQANDDEKYYPEKGMLTASTTIDVKKYFQNFYLGNFWVDHPEINRGDNVRLFWEVHRTIGCQLNLSWPGASIEVTTLDAYPADPVKNPLKLENDTTFTLSAEVSTHSEERKFQRQISVSILNESSIDLTVITPRVFLGSEVKISWHSKNVDYCELEVHGSSIISNLPKNADNYALPLDKLPNKTTNYVLVGYKDNKRVCESGMHPVVVLNPNYGPASLTTELKKVTLARGIALSPKDSKLYVTGLDDQNNTIVSIIDTSTNKPIGGINLNDVNIYSLNMPINAEGSELYMVAEAGVLIVNTLTRQVKTIAPSITSHYVDISHKDDSFIYADNMKDGSIMNGSIAIINKKNNEINYIPNIHAWTFALHPTGQTLFAAVPRENSLYTVDVKTKTVTHKLTFDDPPMAPRKVIVSSHAEIVYVLLNQNDHNGEFTIAEVDVTDANVPKVKAMIDTIGRLVWDMALHPDGSKLYVSCVFDKKLAIINTANFVVCNTIDTAMVSEIGAITVAPEALKVYVTCDEGVCSFSIPGAEIPDVTPSAHAIIPRAYLSRSPENKREILSGGLFTRLPSLAERLFQLQENAEMKAFMQEYNEFLYTSCEGNTILIAFPHPDESPTSRTDYTMDVITEALKDLEKYLHTALNKMQSFKNIEIIENKLKVYFPNNTIAESFQRQFFEPLGFDFSRRKENILAHMLSRHGK